MASIKLAILVIALAWLSGCWTANAEERPWRVLHLNAYNNTNPAPATVDQAARRRFREFSSVKIDTYTEFLDLIRFPGEVHEIRMAKYLAEKYAQVQPDVVMVFSDASLNFAMKYRELVAPQVPIVFTGVSPELIAAMHRPSDVTGFTLASDYAQTFALAERLQPKAGSLIIINGGGDIDRQWLEAAREQLGPKEGRFTIRYLTGVRYETLLAEVSRLPRETIVIYTPVFGDGTGRVFVPAEVAESVAKAASAPVYGTSDSYLGRGIVGGYMDTHENLGITMADLVVEILAGRDPATVVPKASTSYGFRVDARALKRWFLSETNLPDSTIVAFKEATPWDEYRYLILAVFAAFGLQTVIIFYVLTQNRRRRRAEQSLKANEERMAFAAASTGTGLWQMETKDFSFWITDHCRNLFGLAADTTFTLGTLLPCIHEEDRAVFDQSMRTIVHSTRATEIEFRVVKPDGETRWIAARAYPGGDTNDPRAGVSGIFVDVTRLKMAEGDVEQQRREVVHLMRQSVLGELSGAIAHELNQPLAAILSNAEAAQDLLARKNMDLDEVRNILRDIIEDDNRAGHVIHRLRKLLRKGESKSEPINLNQLVESTLSLLNGELVRRKINVDVALSAGIPEISGDSVQLQQVLLNLIMNAIEAMSAKSLSQHNLIISTREHEGLIEAVIVDNGHGLTTEVQTQLFKPFFTTKKFGLGLGLPICSTIVKSHGGQLRIHNNTSGGATAVLALPTPITIASA